ncbi:ATP-binding cassette domain-containing protein [Beijerinckia indica]|uniref:ABC transporter related n=1 Tax=Beijerinckia indica subsp. indica (strain ATCC 9039 / DSM 1715 / NCIMB 8712) TaxID=395963 RepID=B2II91_BEII9|nr:ATP-binding cassette domain-containing protein [Beijerinckia indica]ACB96045.1 ABC transporter related [Beijerinckia indica subsp. indica ATCC 9039]
MSDVQERTPKNLPDFDGLFREPSLATGIDLSIRGLGKSFGEKQILHGLDLKIPAGQFVAVVGRSGCGKSTLLRLVAGLDEPSEGEIRFGEGAGPRKNDHPVRVMFQEPRLLPWARLLANVEIGLGMQSSTRENTQSAQEALRAVGLGERAQEWPSVLSGGQKQRVALARALVSKPRLLAFDEPLGALDALTRIEMQGLLERIWLRDKFTALLVTHDVSEALTLADRVIMIEGGRITLDLDVDLPRPRRRGSVDLALLEEKILDLLLRKELDRPEYEI